MRIKGVEFKASDSDVQRCSYVVHLDLSDLNEDDFNTAFNGLSRNRQWEVTYSSRDDLTAVISAAQANAAGIQNSQDAALHAERYLVQLLFGY